MMILKINQDSWKIVFENILMEQIFHPRDCCGVHNCQDYHQNFIYIQRPEFIVWSLFLQTESKFSPKRPLFFMFYFVSTLNLYVIKSSMRTDILFCDIT